MVTKKMLVEKLDPLIRETVIDTMTAAELVDFLNIDIAEIVDLLEDKMLEHIPDLQYILGFDTTDDNDEHPE